jgi:hypothetical protein|tara:strand:- start:44 stop:715 length:672 start_codon:yes stop_codon:yes gene_type:complete
MTNIDQQEQIGEQIAETETAVETLRQDIESRTFTQDEVDAIVKTRLNKVNKKYENINLTEYKSMKEEKENAKVEGQKARGEFESILQEQKDKFEVRFNNLNQQLHKEKVEGAILKAAGSRNAVDPAQVAQLLQNRVRLSDDGDVQVLNSSGEVMYDTDNASPLTIDTLVNTFLDSSPHFLRAGPSGSGSTGNVGESVEDTDISQLDLSDPAQRAIYAKYKANR